MANCLWMHVCLSNVASTHRTILCTSTATPTRAVSNTPQHLPSVRQAQTALTCMLLWWNAPT